MIAQRLVSELMPVSVLVAGDGADTLAAALTEAGAMAEILVGSQGQSGCDLAILLGAPDPDAVPDLHTLIASLSEASDRLLFAPLPLRGAAPADAPPTLPALTRWFEMFADFGYQPVVGFDAGFVAAGAFLVDRASTAAESDLAAFADRLQDIAGPSPSDPGLEPPDPALEAEISHLHAERAAQLVQFDALTAEAAAIREALQAEQTRNAGWDGLRAWVNFVVTDPARDTEAALRRDLPRLNALRGPDLVPIVPAVPGAASRPGFFARLFGRRAKPSPSGALLEGTAIVHASKYFDPAWYIASTPDLCEGERIDPVFHYVFVGAPNGADPGPWFDSAAYLKAHPEAGDCPLLHAIRTAAPEANEAYVQKAL